MEQFYTGKVQHKGTRRWSKSRQRSFNTNVDGDSDIGSYVPSTIDNNMSQGFKWEVYCKKTWKTRLPTRSTRSELEKISLEVLLVPDLGPNLFSMVAFNEKGVKLDLLHGQPVLRCGGHTCPIRKDMPRTYKLDVIIA